MAWHVLVRAGVSFACIVEADDDEEELDVAAVQEYLAEVAQRYVDEVDAARYPVEEGVAAVILDVIAPWED